MKPVPHDERDHHGHGDGKSCHHDAHDHHDDDVKPSATTKYYCPMCEGVESDEPGDFPKCGMNLEPLSAVASEDDGDGKAEIRVLARKFWIGLALTVPVLLLAFDDMIPKLSFEGLLSVRVQGWLELLLATPVIFWAGGFFFTRAWRSIVNRSLNMFTLIALGVGAAVPGFLS